MRKRDVSSNKASCLWISRMLSEGDGTPSTKRVCFFGTTLAAIIFCGCLLCSKNAALGVDLAKWLLTTVGGAFAITRFAEYGSAPSQS